MTHQKNVSKPYGRYNSSHCWTGIRVQPGPCLAWYWSVAPWGVTATRDITLSTCFGRLHTLSGVRRYLSAAAFQRVRLQIKTVMMVPSAWGEHTGTLDRGDETRSTDWCSSGAPGAKLLEVELCSLVWSEENNHWSIYYALFDWYYQPFVLF